MTDEELMMAYQQGEEQAFLELYKRHSGRVYGYLRKRLPDRSQADDVFQATFLKLHQARARYDQAFPFVPWLFTVCRSVMLDTLRKQTRIRETCDAKALETAAAAEPTAPPQLDLAVLGATQRQAVQLRYGQDLSFEEIARKLETSPGNARQLVSRAIRKLRALK